MRAVDTIVELSVIQFGDFSDAVMVRAFILSQSTALALANRETSQVYLSEANENSFIDSPYPQVRDNLSSGGKVGSVIGIAVGLRSQLSHGSLWAQPTPAAFTFLVKHLAGCDLSISKGICKMLDHNGGRGHIMRRR
jgi:hypothetical protein